MTNVDFVNDMLDVDSKLWELYPKWYGGFLNLSASRHNALILHRLHPNWSQSQIAKHVDVSASAVSRWIKEDRRVQLSREVTVA